MENGGGGKGDVPQDANERKKLTSLRLYWTRSSVVLHVLFSGSGVDSVVVSGRKEGESSPSIARSSYPSLVHAC
jgi:hypothetical protein